MPTGSFYVYALLDPRDVPPRPFYVGKGSGSRAYAHLTEEGQGRKNLRIREIEADGEEVIVRQLVSDLSETEALKVEAQLIAAHGTLETGGVLLNKVLPTGTVKRQAPVAVVPPSAAEKAQLGLGLMKEAILEMVAANPEGVTNADIVSHLGLQSDHDGQNKNYLSWSALGILMREGRVRKFGGGRGSKAIYRYVQRGETGVV